MIGAGPAGRKIARATALAGFRTILEDILPASLRQAETEMRADLEEFINQQHLSESEAEMVLSRLEYASSVDEAARQADLVIEAVPDELESKLEIFTLLDKVCRPATILATTAQTLSVTEIASVTFRRDRCIGMRFAFADRVIRLELVVGTESSGGTLTACDRVARKLTKELVIIDDQRAAPSQ